MIVVQGATPKDEAAWFEMRRALWPATSGARHRQEVADFFAFRSRREPQAVLIARDATGRAVGSAEVSIGPFAEGCETDRVAYLEGWFVEPDVRGTGIGRALVQAVEAWGRAQGSSELASDTYPEDAASTAAHLAVGFADVGLVRCFRKAL